ncbi:type II toxin-antitoxin system HipA family toxin [Ramlibacter sp.]|uniref:type II toxin-antitoxin system HipA family toxin n=1 Tax=Ramlibacter sp. TaxID=1917967 RepID=UPI002FC6D56E
MKFDQLHLWFLGDPQAPRCVGTLRLVDGGKGVSLQYGSDWIASGFALSEDLPLSDLEHRPRDRLAAGTHVAVGAVDDARPDRWGERVIQYIDRPRRLSLMEYLFFAGDDRFGALGVSTSETQYLPRQDGPLPRLKQAQELSEVVAKIAAAEPITERERAVLRGGGSFGGAKPKALIGIGGEQWVLKFFNNEPFDSPLVEHATMTLAAKAGIRVAETQVITLADKLHAVAVRRFDRSGEQRIHGISAGTALRAAAAAGQAPEMGYPELALLLRRAGVAEGEANAQDATELFRRMVFNILVDNTDDHEKNHSLLVVAPWDNGRFRLAPAYDVLPSNSGQGRQEFICGDFGHDATLENAMSRCQSFGLDARQAALQVERIIAVVDTWKAHFAACGVSAGDIAQLEQRLDGDELLGQRRTFDAGSYASTPARRPRRSPFSR